MTLASAKGGQHTGIVHAKNGVATGSCVSVMADGETIYLRTCSHRSNPDHRLDKPR